MQNGRDALVASACGTWNTGDIPFSATRRGRSMGHGRDKRDPPARRCRSMGHGRDKRDPPARPSRRRQTGGTRLSRPPTERGTQGTSHSAPRAEGVRWGTVATSATLPRAGAVRWGTVATSATLPRDHPGEDVGRDALVASAYGTWNTGGIPFSATRRGRSMGHGRVKRDPPARPSRRRQREGRACRVRLRNVASARATRLGKPHATRLGQKTKQTRTRIWQNRTGGGRGI